MTKKISVEVQATQFKKGDKTFMGQSVRNLPKLHPETNKPVQFKDGVEEPFAIVDVQGTKMKLDEGMWLVEFPDGRTEVWSDAKMKANGKGEGGDARLEDEDIKKEAADKLVVNYKEHNPKLGPLDGNAPVTGTEESDAAKSSKKK